MICVQYQMLGDGGTCCVVGVGCEQVHAPARATTDSVDAFMHETRVTKRISMKIIQVPYCPPTALPLVAGWQVAFVLLCFVLHGLPVWATCLDSRRDLAVDVCDACGIVYSLRLPV